MSNVNTKEQLVSNLFAADFVFNLLAHTNVVAGRVGEDFRNLRESVNTLALELASDLPVVDPNTFRANALESLAHLEMIRLFLRSISFVDGTDEQADEFDRILADIEQAKQSLLENIPDF